HLRVAPNDVGAQKVQSSACGVHDDGFVRGKVIRSDVRHVAPCGYLHAILPAGRTVRAPVEVEHQRLARRKAEGGLSKPRRPVDTNHQLLYRQRLTRFRDLQCHAYSSLGCSRPPASSPSRTSAGTSASPISSPSTRHSTTHKPPSAGSQ